MISTKVSLRKHVIEVAVYHCYDYVTAGVYVYAVEEFGKLLLLKMAIKVSAVVLDFLLWLTNSFWYTRA